MRISDSESGNLLALGPLRAPVDVPGEHQAEAQINFGLNLEPDDTPVSVLSKGSFMGGLLVVVGGTTAG